MTIQEALDALGVRDDTLSEAEKAQLDGDGFVPLPGMLTPDQVEKMRARLDELVTRQVETVAAGVVTIRERTRAGTEPRHEAGADRLFDLVNKDPLFDTIWTHPRLLAAIAHVLQGEFKLSSLNFRAALPGQGHQGLHADWPVPVQPGDYYVCNSIWLLDDFTERNGATRVVPGAHRNGKLPKDEMEDTAAPHPREVKLIAPAGTAVVFNSHVWHGGTRNDTPHPRRACHAYFGRRDQPQQLDQRAYIQPDTYARLSDAARYILDV
jgi:ectoine hydroxylase-related dioxygenase (phytanoyl-CoA dioxygenase family)